MVSAAFAAAEPKFDHYVRLTPENSAIGNFPAQKAPILTGIQLEQTDSRRVLAGFGVAYLPEDVVVPHLERGRLTQVLDSWCAPFPGYHIYYPSRRQSSPALELVVDALRYKRK